MNDKSNDLWNRPIWGNIAVVAALLFLLGALLIPILSFAAGPTDPKGPAGFIACIGMPSFVVGHIAVIIALASEHVRSKKRACWSLIAIWSGIIIGTALVLFFRDG